MAEVCIQCGAELNAPPALCHSCGAIQPFRAELSLFGVVGLPESYDLNLQELRSQVLQLQKILHPDRFARADATTRRFSLEWSTRLNEALAVLRDPLKRADYLLQRQEIDALGEQVKVADPSLLMTQMMYRERLEDVLAARDQNGLDQLRGEVEDASSKAVNKLHILLKKLPCEQVDEAGSVLRELQFLDKLLGEIDRGEESLQNL
ncbi:Fe-S protein assembly co-chaperone HscB [Acidithiobacillus sp. HP-6]|uniref:Fe-S protein assembly co-chaperone HscB n=1 Tax=unclassified Acidithiobacillus TaxID=2614800 RepID=UPI0018795AD3|nr:MULTISPECIES: Fe-S protein assembly co-chaperone HscB [unclassified Acidithiobacillus]MBE7562072.1 Fe-S protein assembly co-chaperone HscB [Acidithiobacillus sp. HP-6]MBE7568786.1 Fe-S protein assembly co-chaperone HscB [Acidithiobacillus sp. HP-2]MDD2750661.1 Fe-S protein assembly co-chaperone HscB [Acidithiobacillus sp.]MDD5280986.1 Fe-S protein assembly co-chaperone HscB [Acidithiobacillus sp.]